MNPNAAGDIVLYKAADGISETPIFPVIFNFTGGREWQRFIAPQALADDISIAEDEVKEVELFGYDAFEDWVLNESSVITITQAPSHGTLSAPELSSDSDIDLAEWLASYAPHQDYSGSDEIRFIVENSGNNLFKNHIEKKYSKYLKKFQPYILEVHFLV